MTETNTTVLRRPVPVTIALVFIYLSGLGSAVVGILILLSRYRVDADAVLPVSLLGAAVILFGLLTLAVASGVSRGSRLSRLLVTIYLGIELVLHVITIVTTDDWDWIGLVVIAVELFVLVALWAPPGSRWFRAIAQAEAAAVVV